MGRLIEWLDSRTGIKACLAAVLYESLPGGARWRYVWGSTLAFLFVLECVTGVLLMFSYSPAPDEAWGSVHYIHNELTFGRLIRGLHHFGSQAMIVLLAVHFVQVLATRAYRAPREFVWWLGLALALVIILFSRTGYLLPWDQKGYWVSKIETNIIEGMPGLGPIMAKLVVGGDEYGRQTLSRAYALHTTVLPAIAIVLLLAHRLLVRRLGRSGDDGIAPPAPTLSGTVAIPTEPTTYWPNQAVRNAVAWVVVFGALLAIVLQSKGNEEFLGFGLDAPADPASDYPARPEWYLLSLYQLRMYFPGALEIIATGVIPALGAGFLVMLPLLARKFGEDLVHKAALGGVVTGAIGIGVLSWLALAHDAPPSPAMKDGNKAEFERREKFHAVLAEERAIRDYSIARAADGISAGPLSLSGPRLFNSHCRSCHTFEYLKGGGYGDLTGFASAGWIAGLLRKPDAPQYLGKYYTHIPETHRGMMDWVRQQKDAKDAFDKKEKANPPWLSPGQIDDVSEALADIRAHPKMADADRRGEIEALISKPLAEKLGHDRLEAATKALANDCRRCHEIGAKGGGLLTGPSLNGYGTREWLIGIIRNSHDLRFYGESSKMPKFERAQLDERQMDALVDFLLEPRPRRRGEPGRSP